MFRRVSSTTAGLIWIWTVRWKLSPCDVVLPFTFTNGWSSSRCRRLKKELQVTSYNRVARLSDACSFIAVTGGKSGSAIEDVDLVGSQ